MYELQTLLQGLQPYNALGGSRSGLPQLWYNIRSTLCSIRRSLPIVYVCTHSMRYMFIRVPCTPLSTVPSVKGERAPVPLPAHLHLLLGQCCYCTQGCSSSGAQSTHTQHSMYTHTHTRTHGHTHTKATWHIRMLVDMNKLGGGMREWSADHYHTYVCTYVCTYLSFVIPVSFKFKVRLL